MKNQILKIAGVKNEKEFYQKFPTEEAFMAKHGGEFKKAQQGKKLSLKSSKLKLIEDNEGYRNPNNQGHPVSIDQSAPQSYIDMKGINQSLLALDDNEIRLMHPEEQHRFKGNKVIEFPIAQNGYETYNPYFTNNPGQQISSGPQNQWNFGNGFNPGNINTPNMPTNFPQNQQAPGIGEQWGNNNPLPEGVQDTSVPENIGFTPQYNAQQSPDFLSAITTGLPIVGQVLSGITGLGAEKEKRKAAKQMKMVSDVSLMASNTRPEQIERKYNRPEDNVFSQQEMYPTYGTGTNPLAKNGKKLTKAQLGASLTSMLPGLLGGNSPSGNTAGAIGGGIANAITGNNAGGMIGGGLGSIFGPGGKIVGTLLGGALDKNPNRTKRYEQATDRNMQTMAANSQIQGLQSNNSSHMQDGGNMNMNGDLETHWGGEAQPISYNPHLPDGGETVMFRGNSHSQSDGRGNSGIGITYGDNPVEVEAGEPAVALPDSQGNTNLTVFGNLSIPKQFAEIIGDDKAKGKKFKNYIADLSKKEAKHSSLLDKSSQELNSLDMTTPYDKLKFQTLQANILGSNMVLKDIADKKTKAAELQSIINNTAEQHGLSAEHLAKGKIKQAEDGITLIAQSGKTIPANKAKEYLDKGYKQDPNNPSRLYKPGTASVIIKGSPEKQTMSSSVKRNTSSTVHRATSNGGKPNAQWYSWVKKQLNNGVTYDELASKGHGTLQGLKQKFPNEYKANTDNIEAITTQDYTPATKDITQGTPGDEVFLEDEPNFETVPYKRSLPMDIYNQILPYIRPTDQEGLDANQLLGEMNAFATNQLQPVDAQSYQPLLQTPYDISYQDVLNENNADFKSLLKQSNPATQSLLAAQKYQANFKVLGEQFRANQQEKSQVYADNRNTLNDAQLKNLNIFDTQYQRQAQALSNTKAINQSAINSMSSKYQQNKLENRTLGIYENLYNYRYDAAGRAQNLNPLFQANEHNIYTTDKTQPITDVPVTDSKGNIIEYKRVEPQSVSPTLQSPQNYQPILTTAQTTTEYYKPILPGPGVDTSVGTTARRGKTMSKCTNGSIVSSLKKY